jgi:iron complex transport system substrate-binding protein
VGVSSNSIFPPSLKDLPLVGKSSFVPNVEKILELQPDVLIADIMLSEDRRVMIEAAGIPVVVECFNDPERISTVVMNLGTIADEEEKADELASFIDGYLDIIQERTADLEPKDKPTVYLERGWAYHTASSKTPSNDRIITAGGKNIASDEPAEYPLVSAEWIVEMNPEIILREVWSTSSEMVTEGKLAEVKEEILARPGFGEIKAVENECVYVYNSKINSGMRSIIGELYIAKWVHPDLFKDIDPEAVHQELILKFYGLQEEGVYVY